MSYVSFFILIFLGGIFGTDDLCTTGKKCKRHEVYKDTLNPCPLTCAEPNPRPCPYMPINKGGCECESGYVRDEAIKECVRPNNCSAKKCKDLNAEYTVCPNPCPLSCGKPFPGVCTKLCLREGCQCAKGFILDKDNIELGKCIRPENCSVPICPQNEKYVIEDNRCQKTCGNRLSPNSDVAGACVPFTGCICKPGNVRLYQNATGPCMPESECPPIPTECGKNEVATSCRIICPLQSCESILSLYNCPPTECEPGCDCKSNYLRNKDGVCIPSDDCFKTDPIVCGENEVASNCTIQCPPQSCKSLFVRYSCAETNCTTGCNCIAGYLRNSLGVCVPSEECYNDPAGCDGDVNAIRSRGCGTSNPPTCENPNPKFTTDVCILNGCECKPGYIKSSRDGKCIKSTDCPAEFGCKGDRNATLKDCPTPCPKTCDDPNAGSEGCSKICLPEDCECNAGYVWTQKKGGKCIKLEDCPSCKGDTNARFSSCPSACEPTCDNPKPEICTKQCLPPGCVCNTGHVLSKNGTCIKPRDCPAPKCPQNEQYVIDDNRCQKTCENRLSPTDATGACAPITGCVCKPDYVRLYDNATGPCVSETECPLITAECGENEVATNCRITCPPQACESVNAKYYCKPTKCEPGCDCKKNYLRNKDGVCIPSADCFKTNISAIQCGKNEVASDCAIQCPPQSCESLFVDYLCAARDGCTPGCNCIAGYLRNSLGVCVPSEECYNDPAGCGGDVNAKRSRGCASANPPTCVNPYPETTTEVQKTTKVCILNGCECKPGYIKSSIDGKCVEYKYCPKPVCPENEYYTQNNTRCIRTCANKEVPISDDCKPFTGCACRDGFVRENNDATGKCIPESKCPGCNGDPNATYKECRSQCPLTCDNPEPRICIQSCAPAGCECNKGYVLSPKGTCVKPNDCPVTVVDKGCGGDQNATAAECPSSCPPTCANRNSEIKIACPAVCDPSGCVCKGGYILTEKGGKCVKPEDCPEPVCPENEYYTQNNTRCIRTCANKEVPISDDCKPFTGCACRDGFVRENNDATGKCIPENKCPGCNGDPNATYKECRSQCPLTCDNPEPRICILSCAPAGCECNTGYVLNPKGTCVKPNDCPVTVVDEGCGGDQNATAAECPSSCPPTCANRNSGKETVCPAVCDPSGCVCKGGYILTEKGGKCVKPEDCPDLGCNGDVNAIFSDCPSACEPTCMKPNPRKCTKQCLPPSCVCKPDYVLNENTGKCVKSETCPAKGCEGDDNAVYSECPSACEPTCANPDPNQLCTFQCLTPGCVCKPGFVRNNKTGKCIKPETCPAEPQCKGDRNATYTKDSSQCQITCKYPDPKRECRNKKSGPSCVCKQGYLKKKNKGPCIKPQDCPGGSPQCRANETFLYCYVGCPTNYCPVDDSRAIVACDPPYPCPMGCGCKGGYLMVSQEDNRCILSSDCPPVECTRPNEVWDPYAPGCLNERCDNRNIPCEYQYPGPPKCRCIEGYYRNEDDVCVPECDCPQPGCNGDMNATFSDCPSLCPATCANTTDLMCIALCGEPGCVCNSGFVLSEPGGVCIRPEDCAPQGCNGDKNATLSEHPNPCPPVCCDPDSERTCNLECTKPGCECNDGYILSEYNGVCISPSDCEGGAPKCRANMTYVSCKIDCPMKYCPTSVDEVFVVCDPMWPCPAGCECEQGYLMTTDGSCVLAADCPALECPGPNEVWDPSPSNCNNDTCEALYYNCDDPTPGRPRCVCQEGYYRDDDGICVPAGECPKPKCGYNEVEVPCRQICPPQNCEIAYTEYACTEETKICEKGCDCLPDHLRNGSGICIPNDQCPYPSTPVCGINEIARDCRRICPPQTCLSKYALFRCVADLPCEPGCDCVPNYLRNNEGICIPSEKCAPLEPEPTCGYNEVAVECRQICPPQNCDIAYTDYACTDESKICEPGCDCLPDHLRNGSRICVPNEECPSCQIADECKRTCASPNPPNCDYNPPKENLDGSDCKEGYILSELRGKCIPLEECPQDVACNGDPNAIVKRCPKPCPSTCDSPEESPCKRACLALGCECKPGYLLSNATGTCILPDQCPGGNPCGENKRFVGCKATNCPQEYCPVDDSRETQSCDPPSGQCLSGCICGLNRKRKSLKEPECIVSSDCPPVNCTRPNEEWSSCPSCLMENCEDVKNQPTVCYTFVLNCEPSCICKKGHFRNSSGICIPANDCPKGCGGDVNAVFNNCPSACETTCTSPEFQACTDQCMPPGCVCKPGFVKNEKNGKCIKKENCPA